MTNTNKTRTTVQRGEGGTRDDGIEPDETSTGGKGKWKWWSQPRFPCVLNLWWWFHSFSHILATIFWTTATKQGWGRSLSPWKHPPRTNPVGVLTRRETLIVDGGIRSLIRPLKTLFCVFFLFFFSFWVIIFFFSVAAWSLKKSHRTKKIQSKVCLDATKDQKLKGRI